MLSKSLRREAQRCRENRVERIGDFNAYDTLNPVGDKTAKLGNIKVNHVREKADWAINHISGLSLEARVVSHADDEQSMQQEEFLNFQLESVIRANSNYDREMREILRDAAVSGEGLGKISVRRTLSGAAEIILERRNWRGIWYDHDYTKNDFLQSDYLFDLEWHVFDNLKKLYKSDVMNSWIRMVNEDKNPDHTIAQSIMGASNTGWKTGWNGWSRTESDERKKVLYGDAWWRVYTKENPMGDVMTAKIIASPDLNHVHILKNKDGESTQRPGYKMNTFPYIRIVADRYSETSFPYSPLIRNRRGNEVMMNEMMRGILLEAISPKLMIKQGSLPEGVKNPEQFARSLNFWNSEFGGSIILPEIDETNVKPIDNAKRMEAMTRAYEMLMSEDQRHSGAIDASLLGQSTNVSSAVGMQEKTRHARLSIGNLIHGWEYAHKDAGDKILSLIMQFGDTIEYPPFLNAAGAAMRSPPPMDLTQQRVFYSVRVNPSRDVNEALNSQIENLVKTIPQIGGPVMAIVNKHQKLIPPEVERELLEVMARAGVPVPMDSFSMAKRKELEQLNQQKQQQEQEARQIENQERMAKIEKDLAEAARARAEAQKLMLESETEKVNRAKKGAEVNKTLADAEKSKAEADLTKKTPPPSKKLVNGGGS